MPPGAGHVCWDCAHFDGRDWRFSVVDAAFTMMAGVIPFMPGFLLGVE